MLAELAEILESRKTADPAVSYVARLHGMGLTAISDKIEEEADEVIEAARTGDAEHLVSEVADLWFHSLVMLSYHGLGPQHVLDELSGRFGVSGLAEKANRNV